MFATPVPRQLDSTTPVTGSAPRHAENFSHFPWQLKFPKVAKQKPIGDHSGGPPCASGTIWRYCMSSHYGVARWNRNEVSHGLA